MVHRSSRREFLKTSALASLHDVPMLAPVDIVAPRAYGPLGRYEPRRSVTAERVNADPFDLRNRGVVVLPRVAFLRFTPQHGTNGIAALEIAQRAISRYLA